MHATIEEIKQERDAAATVDIQLLAAGYDPAHYKLLTEMIAAAFPLGLPSDVQFYLNPANYPSRAIPLDKAQQLLDEGLEKLAPVSRARSLRHLFVLLGGGLTKPQVMQLANGLAVTSTPDEVEAVLAGIDARDVIQQEQVLQVVKQQTGLPLGTIRQALKAIRRAASDDEAWQDMIDRYVREEPFWFYAVDYKADGHWIRQVDQACSLYQQTETSSLVLQEKVRDELTALGFDGTGKVLEFLQQLKEKKHVCPGDFDNARGVIHFHNGVYFLDEQLFVPRDDIATTVPAELRERHNLRTFTCIPHDLDLSLPVDLPPLTWHDVLFQTANAKRHEYEAALRHAFGDNDMQYRMWWEWTGHVLTCRVAMKKSALLHGVPDTGKTKLCEVLEYILGKLMGEIVFHDICENKLGITSDMYQKLVVYDDDMGDDMIEGFELFKKLTGHSRIGVRFLFRNKFDADNICRYMGSVNKLPPVKNINDSFSNRWIIFFFKNIYEPEDQDHGFLDRVCHPSVAAWIIRKALHHYYRLAARGYFEGMSKEEVLHYWQLESNVVYKFVHECCETGVSREDSAIQADLYAKFNEYRDVCGIKHNWIAAQATFTKQLAVFGYPVRDGGNRDMWNEDKAITESKHVKIYHGIALDEDRFQKLFDDKQQVLDLTTMPMRKQPTNEKVDHETAPVSPSRTPADVVLGVARAYHDENDGEHPTIERVIEVALFHGVDEKTVRRVIDALEQQGIMFRQQVLDARDNLITLVGISAT